ncbi:MAG: site-2 protease family protein [Methanomassiliicoccales archaeon]|nr:site-2 protease family protein [Methanomassiliicoccales archaeon]
MGQAETAAEIEAVKSIVGRHFPIYDVKVSQESLAFYISPDPATLEDNFEKLRKELGERSLIPFIDYKSGEHIIRIARKPEIKRRGVWINWVLLAATFASTVVAGAYWWASYSGNYDIFAGSNILWGAVFFAIPLLAILGTHELCHYLMSKRHGVEASLPFFIPSVPPLGTFGAFISMRDLMPDRKALVDVGVAGPLGGILVTIPIAILGLFLTSQGGVQQGSIGDAGAIGFIMQPLFELLTYIIPIPSGVVMHPMAIAAWVGMLVTAINLLPAGQLDGGHIARGLLGEKAKYLGYVTIGGLFLMSFFYTGWLLFAVLIMFLGLRHPAPLNDISRIDMKRKVIGVVALIVLVATFTPIPVTQIPPEYSFEISAVGSNATAVNPGEIATFMMIVNNTGNTDIHMRLSVQNILSDWSAGLYLSNQSSVNSTNTLEFNILYRDSANVTMEIHVPSTASPTARDVTLHAISDNLYQESNVEFSVRVS